VRRPARRSAIEQRLAWADNLGRAFTGLSLGSILLLAALGLAITYGVMGVINMAHGELLMVGAYSAWAMQSVFRAYLPGALDWYLLAAIPVGFLAAALVGVLMERIVIRHLYGRPLETLLATWGISLFLMQVARTLFGAQNVEVANPVWMAGGIEVLPNLMLPWNRIIIVGFSIAVLAAMWAILNLSRLGMFVRAVTQNRPMAGCVGVPTGARRHPGLRPRRRHRRARRRRPVADRQRRPGHGPGLYRRFVHGRRARRRRPARRCGLGGARARRVHQVPRRLDRRGGRQDRRAGVHHHLHPEASAGPVRPQGPLCRILSRENGHENPFHRPSRAQLRRAQLAAGRAVRRFALIAVPIMHLLLPPEHPLHLSTYFITLIGKILCYAIVAVAMDLIWGYGGILSLGHGLFFALGGYAFGMYLMRQIGRDGSYQSDLPDFMVFLDWQELPWFWVGSDSFLWVALLVLVVPALIAFVFGYFAFRSRIKGVYFSIITQALTYAAMLLFFRNETGFGGNNGFTDFKRILGYSITAPETRVVLFALSALALIGTLLLARYLVTSKYGRVLTAIRDAESRVMFIGYNPLWYKLFVWTLSAMLCAIAGALYVPQVGIINPSEMSVANSIEIAIWVAVGGRGTLIGPVIGAFIVNLAKSWFTVSFPEYWLFFLGTLFIVATLYLPQGVVGLWFKLRARLAGVATGADRRPGEPAHERRRSPDAEAAGTSDNPDWDSGTAELGISSSPASSTCRTRSSSISRTSRSASTASGRSTSCRWRSTPASCAASSDPTAPARRR
jgi:urea transport system permease protein